MFLGFVGKNTLNWFNSISFTCFCDVSSDFLIGRSNLDCSASSEESVIGGKNNISLFSGRFSSNYDRVSSLGSITIDMSS